MPMVCLGYHYKVESRNVSLRQPILLLLCGQVQALPVTAERLEMATRQYSLLSKVHLYVGEGWPSGLPEEFKPYLNRRQELSTEGDCLMWEIV